MVATYQMVKGMSWEQAMDLGKQVYEAGLNMRVEGLADGDGSLYQIAVWDGDDKMTILEGERLDCGKAEIVAVFRCGNCGSVEDVSSVDRTSFGSQYDFCDACGATRNEENDLIAVAE
jgi:hypothetical protein